MRKFKIAAATALATLGMGAAASSASALTRDQGAWQAVTNACLRYQGCHGITLYYVLTSGNGGGCKQYWFFYDTAYVGRKYYTTGIYCSPPYAP